MEIEKELTLAEIAAILDNDESGEALIAQAVSKLPGKVDGCVHYIHGLEDEAKRARDYAKQFSDLARQIEARQERFEGYVKAALEVNSFEKFTGDAFQLSIKKNPPSVITKKDVSAEDSIKYPDFVTTKVVMSWDKKALKEALESGNEVAKELAEIEQKTSLKIGIKK